MAADDKLKVDDIIDNVIKMARAHRVSTVVQPGQIATVRMEALIERERAYLMTKMLDNLIGYSNQDVVRRARNLYEVTLTERMAEQYGGVSDEYQGRANIIIDHANEIINMLMPPKEHSRGAK